MGLFDEVKAISDRLEHNVRGMLAQGKMVNSPTVLNDAQARKITDQTEAAILARTAVKCEHLAYGPQPVCVALSRPTELYCHPCFDEMMRAVAGTPEDLTCDFCRKLLPKLILPVMFQHGTYIFLGGACDLCWDRGSAVDGSTQQA